jgi:hypothetical protein
MKSELKTANILIVIIAWLQIIIGFMIAAISIYSIFYILINDFKFVVLITNSVNLILSSLSLCAGLFLVFFNNKKLGLILTIVNFIFQLVQFSIAGFGFAYSNGVEVLMGYNEGFIYNFNLFSHFLDYNLNSGGNSFIVKLNVFSLIILWFLSCQIGKYSEMRDSSQIEIENDENK